MDSEVSAVLSLFGSLGLGLPLGFLVGWRSRFEWGASVGLLCLAVGGLSAAARLYDYYEHISVVRQAEPAGCLEVPGSAESRSARHRPLFRPTGGGPTLVLPQKRGRCEDNTHADARRVRFVPAPGAVAPAPIEASFEDDPRRAMAAVGVFCAFGGFGLLAGLFFAATAWEQRQERLGRKRAVPDIGPARQRLGRNLIWAGNMALLGTVAVGLLGGIDAPRDVARVFTCVVAGCTIYAAACAVRGQLSLTLALFFAIFIGGFGLAATAFFTLF